MSDFKKEQLPDDQISPKEILNKIIGLKDNIKKNWKLILSFIVAGAIIGWIYDLKNFKKPRYQAYLTFNLDGGQQGGGASGISDLASAFGFGGGGAEAGGLFSGQNFIELVRSRPMLERTLLNEVTIKGKKQIFVNHYIEHSGILDEEWEKEEKLKKIRFTNKKPREQFSLMENVALMGIYSKILEETQFDKNNPKSSFIILKCDMQDEALAKLWIEILIENVTDYYKETTTKKTREVLRTAKNRVDSLSRVMSGMDSQIARYQDANQNVVAQQAMVIQQRMARNSSLVGSLYFSAVQNLEAIRFSLIRETPLVTIISAPILPLRKSEYTMYKSVKAGIIIGFVLALFFLFVRNAVKGILNS